MKVFDLHCDTIGGLELEKKDLINDSFAISLDKVKFDAYVQCFAMFLPDEFRGKAAIEKWDAQFHWFKRQLELYGDRMEQAKTGADITRILESGKVAAVLTTESGAAFAGNLVGVKVLKNDGVAITSLTWNGETELAGGISAPEVGLTGFGRECVAEMEHLGMIADVSHLCDKALDDLMKLATKPFVATHSNSRAVCNVPRNLRDDQFQEIVRRGGLVGINYFNRFLRAENLEEANFTDILRHVEHFLKLGGEEILALGSDFDGAAMPKELDSVEKVADLYQFLCRELGQTVVDKMFFENANRFFQKNLTA